MDVRKYLEYGLTLYHAVDMICNQYECMKSTVMRVNASMDSERVSVTPDPTARETAIVQMIEIQGELRNVESQLLQFQMEAGRLIRLIEDEDIQRWMMNYYVQHMPVHEISKVTHFSENWIRRKIRRGENLLYRMLGNDWEPKEMSPTHAEQV